MLPAFFRGVPSPMSFTCAREFADAGSRTGLLSPSEFREGPSKGDRPHLVLSLCSEEAEVATFAYGSTKATDAAHGAAHVLVDPFATTYRGTGLTHPTYFYPSRLLTFAIEDLPEPSGRIIEELPLIREKLKTAVGLGQESPPNGATAGQTGVDGSPSTHPGSRTSSARPGAW